MFVDLNESDVEQIEVDVAIVGTGACGLAMASQLLASGATVALLESGGFVRTDEAESLNNAQVQGSFAVWINSRSRFLGGSTNCWGGNNSPLDPVDFTRTWVPEAQWPIDLSDLEPFAETVHDLFHLGPTDFSTAFWKRRLPQVRNGLLFEGSNEVSTKLIQRTAVGHLGQLLERALDSSASVTVYLNAQVTNIETNESGSAVRQLEVVSLDRSRKMMVSAQQFVLAAGPENPRLLLSSTDQNPRGIGNDYDQVGRWWLGHLSALRGWIEPTQDLDWSLYDLTEAPIGNVRVFGAMQVSEETQARLRILNGAAILERFRPHASFNNRAQIVAAVKHHVGRESEALQPPMVGRSFAARASADLLKAGTRTVSERFRRRQGEDARIFVRNWCEQAPHPDNRVELSAERDVFGNPKMQITSNLQPEDQRTLRTSFDIIGQEFERFGYGRWISDFPKGESWPSGAINTAHFMGGTRMSSRPEDGVVDRNCQVHGVDNLTIAGASVFPTAGVSMVTYTAVLLALRSAAALTGKVTKQPMNPAPLDGQLDHGPDIGSRTTA